MKHPLILTLAMIIVSSCSKKDVIEPQKDYRLQMLEYFSNKPLAGIHMEVYRTKMDLGYQPEYYYTSITTDQAGETIVPWGYTYRFIPSIDTLWNPHVPTMLVYYNQTERKKIYFFPFTELRLHAMPNDSVNLTVDATIQDTLQRGIPIYQTEYYFNTTDTVTPALKLVTGINNTVSLKANMKDGTQKVINYQIHPTDHKPIHIDLPF